MNVIFLISIILPLEYFSQAQQMKSLNAGLASNDGSIFSSQNISSFQNSNFPQSSNNLLQNSILRNRRIFVNNPSRIPLRMHRLNPSLPLVNLNRSGSGPIIIGMDSNAQQNSQNQKYMIRQGVQYVNGFGGGSFLQGSNNSQNFIGNQNVTFYSCKS